MISVSNKFRMMPVLVALAMLFSFANVSTQVAAQGTVVYDAYAARWAAIGEHYTQLQAQRELELSAAADDAYAARWTAIGEHYTQLQAQQELELSAAVYDANAARWTAIGEHYTQVQVQREEVDMAVVHSRRYRAERAAQAAAEVVKQVGIAQLRAEHNLAMQAFTSVLAAADQGAEVDMAVAASRRYQAELLAHAVLGAELALAR